MRLGERALELTQDPDFGLRLARDVEDPDNYNVGMLALMASPTVGDALERFAAKQRFWGDGDRTTLHPTDDGLVLRYQLEGARGPYARHACECALAEVVLGIRALTSKPLHPELVRFSHARPGNTAEHRRVFGCPIEFGTRHAELVLGRELLRQEMAHANEAFLRIFDQRMQATLDKLPDPASASDRVRTIARTALANGCNVVETARALGTSTRTLQRRLRAEGTSFAEVVDGLRRELALEYLNRGIPLVEVAEFLGYADVTAFHHAFQRWTGTSPARFKFDGEAS
jgi:AraC-like DNA-binding protein